MVACAAFGFVDLLVEPSRLALGFAASQVPFAAGALALARATYPENLNAATLVGPRDDAVAEEMVLRGVVGRGALLDDGDDDVPA